MGIKCTWRWGQRSNVTEHNRAAIPHFKLTRESFQAFPYTETVEDTETLDTDCILVLSYKISPTQIQMLFQQEKQNSSSERTLKAS